MADPAITPQPEVPAATTTAAPCTCEADAGPAAPAPAPVPGPAPAPASHAHDAGESPDRGYVLLWLALLVALGASLVIGALGGGAPGIVAAIFLVAFAKAALVVNHFMGLALEPRWLKLVMVGAGAALLTLYVGLFPDVAEPANALAAAPAAAAGAPRAADPVAGEKVYRTLCQSCHQQDGRGRLGATQIAADFVGDRSRLQKDDEALLRSIADGVKGTIGQMPAWSAATSEQERKDVLAYLRATFGEGKGR